MSRVRAGRDLLVPAALLLLAGTTALTAQNPTAARLSLPEYVARLDAIGAALDSSPAERSAQLSALVSDIPRTWRIDTPQGEFEIPTGRLVRDVRALMRTGDAAVRTRLTDELRTLRSEAALFEQPVRDIERERALLTEILSRPDFRQVRGPTWMDHLKQRALELLEAALRRLFPASQIPIVSRTLMYALFAGSLVVLALWTYRSLRRDAAVAAVVEEPAVPPSKAWSAWLAEAQTAAAGGRWRDAVHLAYWCAVSWLEAKGTWPPDRSRTPREYLRLLPAASEDRAALGALTRRFELVWYGDERADAQAFADAMASLEKIGCPPA